MTVPTNTVATSATKIATNETGNHMKVREASTRNLDFDPRRGRPLKSAAEAVAAIERNRKEASKAAKRGWATRRKQEREISIAAAEAAARDKR